MNKIKVAIFDIHEFEKELFVQYNNKFKHNLIYFEHKLTPENAVLAAGCDVVCAFAHDNLQKEVLTSFKKFGVKLIALRSAGFNHVDLTEAAKLGLRVVRVPAYSPYSVAEHATALILALNRQICRANNRIKDLNFSLNGLVGFDLHKKVVGIVGTGKIGSVFAKIMNGFGCEILAFDLVKNSELIEKYGVHYLSFSELCERSDILSLHLPLNKSTLHLIDSASLKKMKDGVMIINTSRGALIDTKALIQSLKIAKVGYAGLDVYEEEANVFFEDLSGTVLQDDVLARLMTFSNVLITSHQGFLTHEALSKIVETTLQNIQDFNLGKPLINEVKI